VTTPGPAAGVRKHGQDRRATGNPVYRGAGPNPTSGTVDPSGYVDRERRSGLAKAVLAAGRPGASQAQPAGGGPSVDPQLVGETASRVDRREIIRRLARRMTPPTG
jgi:hypothetical protein